MQHHGFFRNRYPVYTWRSCLNSFVRDSRVSASENHDQKRQIGRQKKKPLNRLYRTGDVNEKRK